MSNAPRAKNWSFTLNNYTDDDIARLTNLPPDVSYIIFGKEVAASGTPHLQGTVCFHQRLRLNHAKNFLGNAHLAPTRSLSHSIEYCRKDGDVFESGPPPCSGPSNNRQKRKSKADELEDFKNSVKEGVTDAKMLREIHSTVMANNAAFCKDYINDHKKRHKVDPFPLRDWQQTLHAKLILPPDPREIQFIVDATGNSGKSWFARYYSDLHPNSQIIVPGKKADMALTIDDSSRVFFLDCPKSKQGDFIQYDFLEELKNGYVFSPKYESKNKSFPTPHVVVLMNETPDRSKLSADRYNITILN